MDFSKSLYFFTFSELQARGGSMGHDIAANSDLIVSIGTSIGIRDHLIGQNNCHAISLSYDLQLPKKLGQIRLACLKFSSTRIFRAKTGLKIKKNVIQWALQIRSVFL